MSTEKKIERKIEREREAGNNKAWMEQCRLLGKLRETQGSYDGALAAYEEGLKAAQETSLEKEIAISHRFLAEILPCLGRYNEALEHANEFHTFVKNMKDLLEQQRALATIGRIYFVWASELKDDSEECKTRVKECKKAYMKSLFFCEKITKGIDDKEKQEMKARLLLNIGLAFELENDVPNAQKYISNSVAICKEFHLYEDLHRSCISQSALYLKLGNHPRALDAIDDCLESCSMLDTPSDQKVTALLHKADIYFNMANYQGAKVTLKHAYRLRSSIEEDRKTVEINLKRATRICKLEAELLSTPPDSYEELRKLYEKLGDVCCSIKNYVHAKKCYEEMLKCTEVLGLDKKHLQDCFISLTQTCKDLKLYELAISYAQKELGIVKDKPEEAYKSHMIIGELYELLKSNIFSVFVNYRTAARLAGEAQLVHPQVTALKRLASYQRSLGLDEAAADTENSIMSLGVAAISDSESESEHEDATALSEELSDICESDGETSRQRSAITFHVTRNEKGETPLHVAAIEGDVQKIRRLLDHGHPVKVRDHNGWTPLHEAANFGHLSIVKLLVNAGADINDPGGPDCDGTTPLHDAANCGHANVINFLLDRGALVTVFTRYGESPLDCLRSWRKRVGKLSNAAESEYRRVHSRLSAALNAAGLRITEKSDSAQPSKRPALMIESDSDGTPPRAKRCPGHKIDGADRRRSHIIFDKARPIESAYRRKTFVTDSEDSDSETSCSPPQPVMDYRATIKSMRKKPPPSKVVKTSQPALVPEGESGGIVLVNDLPTKKSTKQRSRRVASLLEGSRIRERKKYSSDSDDSENRSKSSRRRSIENKHRKVKSHSEESCSSLGDGSDCSSSPKAKVSSTTAPLISVPVPLVQIPTPPIVPEKLRVRISEHVLLIPIDKNKLNSLTIGWLEAEAAKRYHMLVDKDPRVRMQTKDGAVFMSDDPLTAAFGEDLVANILGWKSSSPVDIFD